MTIKRCHGKAAAATQPTFDSVFGGFRFGRIDSGTQRDTQQAKTTTCATINVVAAAALDSAALRLLNRPMCRCECLRGRRSAMIGNSGHTSETARNYWCLTTTNRSNLLSGQTQFPKSIAYTTGRSALARAIISHHQRCTHHKTRGKMHIDMLLN